LSDKLQEPWKFEQPVCREIGVEAFYAGDEDDPQSLDSNVLNNQLAKKLCQTCEHIVECAEWGIRHERFGIWGGLSPYELIAARKNRNIIMQSIDLPRLL
jgi:hypothetical protein